MEPALTKHTYTTLMRRLSRAGFKKDFVCPAILPDWWDDRCSDDPRLLQDVEIRVARFLELPLAAVADPNIALTAPEYPEAQLRRVRDVDRDRLGPAIHSATRIAAAVVRCLRDPRPQVRVPPDDGIAWRNEINRAGAALTLNEIVSDLWLRGVPVVPLEVLPAPNFQGIACVAEDRPVILFGHKHDEPGRVAFLVAHEAGHVAAGDCAPGQPIVDEDEEIVDDADIEVRADQYATRVVVGDDTVPQVDGGSFKELARAASEIERATGADASAVIFAWARRTGDYSKATMAVKALYRASGARRQLRQLFDRFVDLDAATESDRALLRCVYGDPERDEAAR
jgi:Zn-dependent peptidase ImmA (M78 family)